MALVTTVTPTVSTADHVPGIPDDGDGNLAGEIDLNETAAWGFVSSFVAPGGCSFIVSGTTLDIGSGRIYRTDDDEQKLITMSAESGISLDSDTKHWIFFTGSNEIEARDADNPPDGRALLMGTVDTSTGRVNEDVRGRTPFPLELLAPARSATGTGVAVETLDTGNVDDSTARLRGDLDALGGAASADVYFQWKQSGGSWSQTTAETLSTTQRFDAEITGLDADTGYEYRAVAISDSGNVLFGDIVPFTTATAGTTAPTVTTDAATNVGASGADINGTLSSLGSYSSVNVYFEYRSLSGSVQGVTTPATLSSTGSFSTTLSGLPSGTTYEFRAMAETSDGTVSGSWVEFTTNAGAGLTVTTDAATGVTDSDATMNGTLNSLGANADSSPGFEFRESGDTVWRERQAGIFTTAPQSFDYTLTTLDAETQYEYRAFADGDFGNRVTGSTVTFSTLGTTMIDDFEDGDTFTIPSNWSSWDGGISAQQSTVLADSWSGEISISSGFESVNTERTDSSTPQPDTVSTLVQFGTQTGSETDHRFQIQYDDGSGGASTYRVSFQGDGSITVNGGLDGGSSIGTWTTGTTYRVEQEPDFQNDTVDVSVIRTSDNTTIASGSGYSFGAINAVLRIAYIIGYSNGPGHTLYVDNVQLVGV